MSRTASRDPALQELLDKQAIHEVLLRYCRGVDRRDEEVLRSVYHADAIHEHGEHAMNAREFARGIVHRVALHDWSRENPLEWEWPDARSMLQGLRSRDDRSYQR